MLEHDRLARLSPPAITRKILRIKPTPEMVDSLLWRLVGNGQHKTMVYWYDKLQKMRGNP